MSARVPLYLWSGGDCQIIRRNPGGDLSVSGGDDLPEAFYGDALDGLTVFDGGVHFTRGMSEEELDELGTPYSAAQLDEWWIGHMRPATDAEILSVLGNGTVEGA